MPRQCQHVVLFVQADEDQIGNKQSQVLSKKPHVKWVLKTLNRGRDFVESHANLNETKNPPIEAGSSSGPPRWRCCEPGADNWMRVSD